MRAFRVAYDGTPYYGFQRQPDVEPEAISVARRYINSGSDSGGCRHRVHGFQVELLSEGVAHSWIVSGFAELILLNQLLQNRGYLTKMGETTSVLLTGE